MAKPLVQFMAETSGACCQWGFMRRYRGLTNKATAKKLGISERTVSDTRSMINNGALRCQCTKNCEFPEEQK